MIGLAVIAAGLSTGDSSDESWFRWAISLVVLFPITVVLLGELIGRMQRRDHPLVGPLRWIRAGVIPLLVGWLFLQYVLEFPADSTWVRILSTLFYLVALAATLGVINAVLFRSADETSWRARVPALFLDLSRFILVLVGTSVILSTVWDRDLGGLLTALGVGSIVIGLALQDTLGNVFAGIAILFEKPYQEGDWIRYGDHLGKVTEINWRSTRLLTHFGDTVVVPNGEIARNVLMNENNLTSPRYETFDIGFSYDHPPNEVKSVLLETVSASKGVLQSPPPQVYTTCYNDFSVDYQIRFAVADIAELPSIRDDFVTRIWYTAKRNGLHIPFPIRTMYHYSGPRSDKATDSQESSLGRRAVSDVLPIEADAAIFDKAHVKRFGAGECIIQRGDLVRELNLVVSGEIEMHQREETVTFGPMPMDAEPATVYLGAGEIFGIQAVLRNQPSIYTVTAMEDSVVVSLSREFIMDLIASKPGFAFQLEQIIESRASQR